MNRASSMLAFAPGGHTIAAYGAGAFAFAGMSHEGSILATPQGVRPIEARSVEDLDRNALAPLFLELAEAPKSIELVVIGTGARLAPVPKALTVALGEAGLRFEAMATGPALRVYNVMQSERRRVAAALIATPVSGRDSAGADALAEANRHCAGLARTHVRDEWLGALYADEKAREALLALASFDYEIRQAPLRARDPNLAAIRLAWWRGIVAGERPQEAAGSPVALALRAAIDAFALPRAWLEAMLDARLQEIAPQDDFDLVAFRHFADESEGARLRLAGLIAAGGHDLDDAQAHAPAGMALALTRLLLRLPFKAGAAPTLVPADVAARHDASAADFDARRASPGVVAGCAELRGLAREELAEAERRLKHSPPAILPAFIPLGALPLDLDRLERNASRPFDSAPEASPLRRQWAIWRWARRF